MKIHGSANVHSVLNAIGPYSADPLVIDFSDVAFAEPVALVGAAAVAEDARRAGRSVSFITSLNPHVANYISRMQMATVLDRIGASHNIAAVRVNPLPSDLLELQKVNGSFAGEGAANLVLDKLSETNADKQVCEALPSAINETVTNVEFHAEVDGAFVAVQTTHGGTKIMFAVADSGRGIRKSIEESTPVNDDANALEMAVTANISGTGELGRGQGLPAMIKAAIELLGKVDVASGLAHSEFKGSTVVKNAISYPFPGTIIQVELDCVPGS